MLSKLFRAALATVLVVTSTPAHAEYIFRYKQPVSPASYEPEVPGEEDPGYGIGNDVTVFFTGAIGYEFSKVIPVATQDVVEWKRISGSYQPGLTLDSSEGVISGLADGTTAQRKALLMGYDAAGNAIARANITFRFVNPVGAPQGLVFYGHTGKYMSREIPASVPVARWEALTPLPSEFSTQGRYLNGTPLKTYDTGVAFVGYDYMDKEVAFTTGELIVQEGPTFEEIADQQRHPEKLFAAAPTIRHKVGELRYRLIALDGKPSSLGFNTKTGLLKGTIPTFNTSLRFQIEAVDADGTKGESNVFTFSTYAPDVDLSNIDDMYGTAGSPFAVRLTGEDLSGDMNWQVIAGELPEGLVLDPETGEITGTPVKEEVQEGIVISVSTSDNGYGETRPFSFRIHHEQVVVSFDPLDVRIGESFTTSGPTFEKGIIEPYAFRVAEGAVVDPALTVEQADATVSGRLATVGSYDVPFAFTNGDGRESTFNQPIQAYNPLAIAYADPVTVYRRVPADVLPTVPENSIVGEGSFTLESGTLPDGLYLNRWTGGIYGSAKTEGLASAVSVRLADESGESVVSNTFSLNVQDRPDIEVTVANSSIERYVENTVRIVDASNYFDGVTYELVAGTLPEGLSFNPEGFIEGATSAPLGTYAGFQVRATDGEGYAALSPVFSIEIVAPSNLEPLKSSDASADWTVGIPFALQLPRPGNAYGPISYVLADLPEGVSVSGDRLAGTIHEVGSRAYPMTLTDDAGRALSGTFTLNILEPMSASLAGSSAQVSAFSFMRMASSARFDLPRGSETSISARITNGIAPIAYSFSGTLPDGLSYADGAISGIPVVENQSHSMTLTVRDAAGTTVALPAALNTTRRLAIDLTYDFSGPAYLNRTSTLPRKPAVKNAIGATTYEVTAGELPPGMKIEPKTGFITGVPTKDGRFAGVVVTATDSEGSEFSGSYGPFEIGVSRLGVVGIANSTYLTVRAGREFLHMLKVSNVTHPLTFVPTADDGIMPHGLTLGTTDGSVSGTLAEGEYDAGVRVTDDFGRGKPTTLRITAVGPLALAAPVARTFNQYANVNVKPVATNPVGATRYELVAGTLPAGLALNASTGAITGVPTVVGTASGLVLRLTDATGDVVQTPAFSIAITNRLPLTIATAASYPVIANKGYRFTVPVTNAVGKVTFTQTGTLPPGISFSAATGQIYGVATNIGSFPVTVTATDSVGGTATKTFTLAVATNNQPINLAVTDFVTKVGRPILTVKPTYSNHVGDIRFWADETLAQNGLSIDPATGVISGTATELLDFTPNIHITDGSDRVTSKPIRIQVIPGTVINGPAHIDLVVNAPVTGQRFMADNVVGSSTWSYEGTLPAGLLFERTYARFSGTPKEIGAFRGTIYNIDSLGDVGSASVEIVIANNGLPPTISFTPSSGGYIATSTYTRLVPTYGNQKTGDVVDLAPDSSPLPPGMTIIREASGIHVLSKAAGTSADVGVYRGIKLRVTDVDGLYSEVGPMTFLYVSNPRLAYPAVSFSSRPNVPISIAPPVPSAGLPSADVSFAFSSQSLGGRMLTINADTGAIGGYITASGSNVVTVTESYDGITIRTFTYNVAFTLTEFSMSFTSIGGFVGLPLGAREPVLSGGRPEGSYSLSGDIPSWLAFDSMTGVVSGNPDAVGVHGLTLTYRDDYATLSRNFSVSITDGSEGYRYLKFTVTGTSPYGFSKISTLKFFDENGGDVTPLATVVSSNVAVNWNDAIDADSETSVVTSGTSKWVTIALPRSVNLKSAYAFVPIYSFSGKVSYITGAKIEGSTDGVTFVPVGTFGARDSNAEMWLRL